MKLTAAPNRNRRSGNTSINAGVHKVPLHECPSLPEHRITTIIGRGHKRRIDHPPDVLFPISKGDFAQSQFRNLCGGYSHGILHQK
jgi:hypothetical protein